MTPRGVALNGKAVYSHAPTSEVTIAPSILSADFAELAKELARCRRARTRWIHVDVMDGHFVPNLTIGPLVVKSSRNAEPNLFYDTHLMIENPNKLFRMFRDAGSGLITFHVEASPDALRDMRALRRMGLLAGISIKPATPVKAIVACLPLADLVLVMTVEPGFGGQPLIPKTLNKVRELDLLRRREGYSFRLQVDGGITQETAPLAVAAGADVLVAGSSVFGGERPVSENIKALREAVARAPATSRPLKKAKPRKRRAKA